MKIKFFYKKNLNVVSIILCIFLGLCAVIFSAQCKQGVLRGIDLCLNQLVPSLFIIIVIVELIIRCGISNIGGRLFTKFANIMFGVSRSGMWAILLSLVGGYPVGARAVATMYNRGEISYIEAVRLADVCVCAGTGFLINFVGASLLHNKNLGIILFVAQVMSVLVIATITRFTSRQRVINTKLNTIFTEQKFSSILVESVNSGAKTCLYMSSAVVAFSGFIALIQEVALRLFGSDLAFNVLKITCEVTGACEEYADKVSLCMLGFIVGFGGICVHFQIFGILSKLDISKSRFLLFRVIQGMLTAGFVWVFLRIFPQTEQVFATISTTPTYDSNTTVFGATVLVLTMSVFIFTIWRKNLCVE